MRHWYLLSTVALGLSSVLQAGDLPLKAPLPPPVPTVFSWPPVYLGMVIGLFFGAAIAIWFGFIGFIVHLSR
jgi:hypothetical protein